MGQGCCSGDVNKQESNLADAAKNGQPLKSTPGLKGNKQAFFKRQSTALSMNVSSSSAFYGNIVISCTGKGQCHSNFSKLILSVLQNEQAGTYDDLDSEYDFDEDNKEQCKFTDNERKIIRGAFWKKDQTLRKYTIRLLKSTQNDDKYTDLYNNLNNDKWKVDDQNAIFILNQFVKIIENDDEYLLQCLANFTCTFGSRPLWNEINENTKDNDEDHLTEETIIEKVEEVRQGKFYLDLKKKGIELADNEILAVYIYTVNDEFADLMQKNFKIPCKWKQTFYYFVRGILKIYDALIYNKPSDHLPKRLYHPIFGQSRLDSQFEILSTVNCTENEDGAKDLAPPDGTMYVFENTSTMLSKGKLIAAPISWISNHPEEKEWVILPLRIFKIDQSKSFSVEKNCKEVTITKYETFSATLYGVDVFGKLGNLEFVKQLQSV